MAALSRHIHLRSSFAWEPLAAAAPDLTFTTEGEDEAPMALTFVDPDGEKHVFAFGEEARKSLVSALTGGVVLANGAHA